MVTRDTPASPRFFAGRLLMAMPGIGDDNFDHAVIAMCSHDEHGALGLDIGKVIEGFGLRDMLANFGIDGSQVPDMQVLRGGPVEPQRGFVLHSADWGGQDVLHVNEDWRLSGSLDVLRAIADGTGPSVYMVALGYAGWGAGQLEEEMSRHGWFLGEPIIPEIFGQPPARRWVHAFAASGVDARLLSGASGTA